MIPRVQVGKTMLGVSRLGFGTAPLGAGIGWQGEPIPEAQAVEAVHTAFAQGITFFDTSPLYGGHLAEQRLGLGLADLPREQLTLATKVGYDLSGPALRHDYSRDGVLRSLEGSLTRLGVSRVDIVHIHDPDLHEREALDEAFPALAALRAQGIIGAVGAGMNQWEMLARFARHADFDCFMLAGQYTLLNQDGLPLLEECAQRGIAIFAAGVYRSGILATGSTPEARFAYSPAPDAIRDQVDRLAAVCARHKVALHTAATHFPLAHRAVTSMVVGFQSPAEVQTCVNALQQSLPAALWRDLREAGLIMPDAPTPDTPSPFALSELPNRSKPS